MRRFAPKIYLFNTAALLVGRPPVL